MYVTLLSSDRLISIRSAAKQSTALCLANSPEGRLHAATRNDVWQLAVRRSAQGIVARKLNDVWDLREGGVLPRPSGLADHWHQAAQERVLTRSFLVRSL